MLADGRSLTEVPDGADLELTIDYEAQFNLEQELHSVVEKFEAAGAMGIVMDAQTSEIMAMANLPLSSGRNRLVTDAFEPGSIMKTFVIASSLRENLVRPSTRYFCERGRWKIGDKWIKEAMESEKFEWLNVTEILAHSSNIGTAKIAFDVGAQRLFQGLMDFGFGAKTGVDLPGEARGIVNPLPWRPHLLSNVSFGHGIAVTPMQMVAAYGAIANGGMLKKPLLVRRVKRRASLKLKNLPRKKFVAFCRRPMQLRCVLCSPPRPKKKPPAGTRVFLVITWRQNRHRAKGGFGEGRLYAQRLHLELCGFRARAQPALRDFGRH